MEENANALNDPGLILTVKLPETNETGELTFIGEKLSLIDDIQIINFTFIGQRRCFTIYESMDFMGNSSCLVPGKQIIDQEYNSTEHTVGSISIGCKNDSRCIIFTYLNGSNNVTFISSKQIMFSTLLGIFVMYF